MKGTGIVLRLLIVTATVITIGWHEASSCSTFVLHDGSDLVFGGNLDFYTSNGLVIVNKAGVAKTAFLAPPEKPISWVSKYGSITFNQVGREFPFGGMNEAGLVIELMWLEPTEYPSPDDRPAIQELQWIQYQLDNAGTVQEVIVSDSELRISSAQATSRLHYLVCDRQGNAATVEFIAGQPVYHTGETLPVAALANRTYGGCLEFYTDLDKMKSSEQRETISYSSEDRFVRIARAVKDYDSGSDKPAVEYAFDVLQSVKAPQRGSHRTAWSIVYDIANKRMFFKTFENSKIRVIKFDDFDFSCATPVMVMDMNAEAGGGSDDFVEYSVSLNQKLIASTMAAYKASGFLTEFRDEMILLFANYPESLICR